MGKVIHMFSTLADSSNFYIKLVFLMSVIRQVGGSVGHCDKHIIDTL